MEQWEHFKSCKYKSKLSSVGVSVMLAIFARLQSAKELGGVEYRSVGVVIKKDTLSQSHQWSHGGTEQQTKGL